MLKLRSFRTQLLLLFIGLLSSVLVAVFIAVNQANEANARRHLEESLQITARSFQQTLAARQRILFDKARLLSGDFAFKKVVATQDHATIVSALENHRLRVKATVMMLADLDGVLIADTLHPEQHQQAWSLQGLQKIAMENGKAGGIQLFNGTPYQLVLTPLYTPEPSAWIAIGFKITDRLTQRQAQQTHSDVSLFYQQQDENWSLLASTLQPEQQNDLLKQLQQQAITSLSTTTNVNDIFLQKEAYLSMVLPIQGAGEGQTLVVLQRSLAKALKPYLRLRTIMLLLFGLALLFSIVSAVLMARSMSRPLEALTKTVQHITTGNYHQAPPLQRHDELGILSKAVNQMSQGLQERDQVRNLLGKVVSPEIANELLSKRIELGGEERQATILFSDIRQFTNLCEGRNPKDILQLLNRYLSQMSVAIEQYDGVIDKYIGDAIMALFDLPVKQDNAAEHAVFAAIAMSTALARLNADLLKENQSLIRIGIGINSGKVVAGNMGSPDRLNYTVIGDSVNLAARLEGLTKYFGVGIIVSEATKDQCEQLRFRALGRVQVKGKQEVVNIFEPLTPATLSIEQESYLQQHQQALDYFYQQRWSSAHRLFQHLQNLAPDFNQAEDVILYQLYLNNIAVYKEKVLPENWQGELSADCFS
ncbi:MAG: HAMP domain-containing protein [Cocleimonas sp.]|nr:HAMP domain-containing protein [Cocleimonas sp.]